MRIFLKEHLGYILIYILNFMILLLFYNWMGGLETTSNLFYFIFLCLFTLSIFLVFKYVANRNLYEKISSKSEGIEDTLGYLGSSPLTVVISSLLREQYKFFQNNIEDYNKKQKEHLIFINQWVHQMKTPLSVINLITQQNENEPYMDSIKAELDRLDRGLNMALYMARLDTFTQDFRVKRLRLKPLIIEVINDMKRYFVINEVYPQVDIMENTVLYSDEKWLKFILEQILINGVKYSYMKSNKIYIKGYNHEKSIILEIKDEGVGIPKKDIKRILEPFYTGENGRKFGESTGMGLYIVGEVCRGLSHQIEFESIEGIGTTVRLIFK